MKETSHKQAAMAMLLEERKNKKRRNENTTRTTQGIPVICLKISTSGERMHTSSTGKTLPE
jgi:hypothetical protein